MKTGETLWSKTWNLGSEDSLKDSPLSDDGGIVLTGYRDGLAEGTFLNWGSGVVLNRCKWQGDMAKGFVEFHFFRVSNPTICQWIFTLCSSQG